MSTEPTSFINERINALEKRIEARFDALEQRMGSLEQKMDAGFLAVADEFSDIRAEMRHHREIDDRIAESNRKMMEKILAAIQGSEPLRLSAAINDRIERLEIESIDMRRQIAEIRGKFEANTQPVQ
jgi:uncharacterized protein YceH (UPF0502 family)